jgi:hypothetical protein
MARVTRADRTIVVVLIAVLSGLVGLGLAQRGAPAGRANNPTAALSTRTPGPSSTAALSSPSSVPVTPTTPSPSPSSTAPAPTTTTTPSPVAGPVSAVGDSIMIDIQPYLQTDIPGVQVDGMVSRQFETGIGVVQADRAAGTLGAVLVVELGANGTVTASDFDAMMQAAAGVKRVVFVNINVPRPWEAPDNAVLAAGVARYPGVAVLADWNTLSAPHPEWFTSDQVHLEPAGAQAMAGLVAQYV